MKLKQKLTYGDASNLAKLSGMKRQHIYEILHRKRGVSMERAKLLEQVAHKLGISIPWHAFLMNKTTGHPAFKGKTKRG